MSKQQKELKRALSAKPGSAEYEVGYAKPPQNSRFQKGQSGNPSGRPKGAKNIKQPLNEERLKSIIMEEAYREVTVRDGDRSVTVPIAQAIIRSMALKAAKGDHRSQRLFTELLSIPEHEKKVLREQLLEEAIKYKTDWENELEYRKRTGASGPEPLPHPDNIVIDMKTGEVHINGPITPEEKKELDEWRQRKIDFDAELELILTALEEADDPETRARIEKDKAQVERILHIISQMPGIDKS